MTSFVWIVLLASLVATKAQDGFDLADAFGDDDPEPTDKPKVPEAPKIPEPAAPAEGGGGLDLNDALGEPDNTPEDPKKPAGDGFDLSDALGPGETPTDPKKPATDGELDLNDAFGGADGFDLNDALGPDPVPDKPAVVPPKDGGTGGTGGGSFNDNDLFDVSGGSDYKPDKGKGGARASDDNTNDPGRNGPASDQPADGLLGMPWAQGMLQKLLGDELPEGLHVWIANLKAVVQPLLERTLELIDVAMGNQKQEE
ncbi:CD99 molecule [Sardina pilchardus]|uniref:CD99 molecule n=1 Tax=Sardina pilchardus TaxID=27697 RepID=UPI002E10D7CC